MSTQDSTAIVEEYKGMRKLVTEQKIVVAHNGRRSARQIVRVSRPIVNGKGYGKFAVEEVLHNANFGREVLGGIVANLADAHGLPASPSLYGITVNGLTVYKEDINW